MNIYIVKVLDDICKKHNGLKDIKIYPFSCYQSAVDKLNELYEDAILYFLDEYKITLEELKELDDIHYSKEEDSFCIADGNDYFSAILEKEVL